MPKMHQVQASMEALAAALADKAKRHHAIAPIEIQAPLDRSGVFDSVTRECMRRRIRFLTRTYKLQWLVEQESFNHASIDTLADEQLRHVMSTLERARECIADNTCFHEAGLIRTLSVEDEWTAQSI